MGGVGLVGHGEPVRGAHPAAVPVVGGDGVTGVPHGDPHPATGGQRPVGRDDEVLVGAGEGRGQTVDLHRSDVAVCEVEVDAVEFGRRPGIDRGDGREWLAVVAGIGEGEVVRRHVVAGVAEVREKAVTDPERCGRGARGQQADGDGRGEQRGRLAPSGVSGTATGASGPGRSAWVGCVGVGPACVWELSGMHHGYQRARAPRRRLATVPLERGAPVPLRRRVRSCGRPHALRICGPPRARSKVLRPATPASSGPEACHARAEFLRAPRARERPVDRPCTRSPRPVAPPSRTCRPADRPSPTCRPADRPPTRMQTSGTVPTHMQTSGTVPHARADQWPHPCRARP